MDQPPKPTKTDSSKAVIIIVLLVVLGGSLFCCCPALVLLPALSSARESARRAQCSNHLKQIGLAMLSYETMNGSYPPAYVADKDGNPLYSWRVLLLPFMEQQSLYDQLDLEKAWDSPENIAVSETVLEVFQCSSKQRDAGPLTDYMVIVGPETMFPGAEGSMRAQIRDGASNTVMVVEVLDTGVHWAEPQDITSDDFLGQGINNGHDATGCGSNHPGGAMIGMADGSVHFLADDTTVDLLRALSTRNGGEVAARP